MIPLKAARTELPQTRISQEDPTSMLFLNRMGETTIAGKIP